MTKEKPFIKLLKSPNGSYFYDINRNKIISISEDTYTYLDDLMNRIEKSPSSSISEEISSLKENGYLGTNRICKIQHPLVDYLDVVLSRRVKMLTLQLTQACNLRCDYCIYSSTKNQNQRKHSTRTMSLEMVKKGIDFLLSHSIDSDLVSIAFYGGEPVLEFNLIREAVQYAEQKFDGKAHSYSMTTNATLLDKEKIRFFNEYKFKLMFSMDGPRIIHDKNRVYADSGKGTFDDVKEKLEYIGKEYPDLLSGLSINSVVDPCNDYDLVNSISNISSKLDQRSFNSSILDRSYDDAETVYSESYIEKESYHRFLAYLQYSNRLDKSNVSIMALNEMMRLDSDFQKMQIPSVLGEISAPGGPCIPGQMRLFVNVDGDFFPCERVSELSRAMKIGSLDKGFDLEQCKKILNVGALTESTCKTCWAFNQCSACARLADDGDCLSGEKKLKNCEWIRRSAEKKLKTYILMHELNSIYRPQKKMEV